MYLGDLVGYEFSKIDEHYVWDEEGLKERLAKVESLKQLFQDFANLTKDMDFEAGETTEEESEL